MARSYDRIRTIADQLLAAIVDHYEAENVELPELRFVSNGTIPYDGELLSVGAARLFGLSAGGDGVAGEGIAPLRCYRWSAVQFEVVLLRCSPTPPDNPYDDQPQVNPDDVEANASDVYRDAEMVTHALVLAAKNGDLGEGANLALEDWNIVGEGGLSGGVMRVRVGMA